MKTTAQLFTHPHLWGPWGCQENGMLTICSSHLRKWPMSRNSTTAGNRTAQVFPWFRVQTLAFLYRYHFLTVSKLVSMAKSCKSPSENQHGTQLEDEFPNWDGHVGGLGVPSRSDDWAHETACSGGTPQVSQHVIPCRCAQYWVFLAGHDYIPHWQKIRRPRPWPRQGRRLGPPQVWNFSFFAFQGQTHLAASKLPQGSFFAFQGQTHLAARKLPQGHIA